MTSRRVVWEHDNKLVMFGGKVKIDACTEVLNKELLPKLSPKMTEGQIRLILAPILENHNIKAEILYNGNGVYRKNRLLRDIRLIKRNGMEAMTDYLYQFLSLCCGSIAHYNKHGWIATYPTIDDLKQFFCRNEYGNSVYDHIPDWKTECKEIVLEMEKILGITRQVSHRR